MGGATHGAPRCGGGRRVVGRRILLRTCVAWGLLFFPALDIVTLQLGSIILLPHPLNPTPQVIKQPASKPYNSDRCSLRKGREGDETNSASA